MAVVLLPLLLLLVLVAVAVVAAGRSGSRSGGGGIDGLPTSAVGVPACSVRTLVSAPISPSCLSAVCGPSSFTCIYIYIYIYMYIYICIYQY